VKEEADGIMNRIHVQAKDGAAVPVVVRRTAGGEIKGAVIVSHGFGEHAGSYDELAERLSQAGYASVIFDQRGHGDLPPRARGVVPSYRSFLDDIDAVAAAVKREYPGVPLALYGHSMGGNIAANVLLRPDAPGFACAVLESPWFGLYKNVNPLVAGLAKAVGGLSVNAAIVNKLIISNITGDEAKQEWFANDPLYHNRISMRLFTGIGNACKYALNNASKLTVPTFVAAAQREKIISNPAIRRFTEAAGRMVTFKEYDSCHAIHNDVQRESFYRDMAGFLDAHCPVARND
jgi:alpha-beta hydrolase superfamily lysophospholipase